MAIVIIKFDAGSTDVVQGDVPASPDTPIADPQATGFVTNKAFMVPEGVYCFGLKTQINHRPLWQVVQAIDGETVTSTFARVSP